MKFLEKLVVSQLTIESTTFLNLKIHYCVHSSPQLNATPSQLIPAHALTDCLFKVRFNNMLPSTLIFNGIQENNF
jgi:hypothetical protein